MEDTLSFYGKTPSDKRLVTIRQLLTHTGGMSAHFLLEQDAEDAEDALRVLLERPLRAPGRKRVHYSGMGFLLLGKLLEQVYGMSLDAAAKKYIFAPLGLSHTGYLPTGEDIAFTDADSITGEPRTGMPDEENTRFMHGVSGRAGVFSDIEDCSRFLAMLTCGGKANGQLYLTPESVRLMTTNHTPRYKEAWGLGVRLADTAGSFLVDLWPANGYGQVGATGSAWAVDPNSGFYVALLSGRVQMAHESRAFQRFLRTVWNSAYAQVLRMEEMV